MIKKYRVKARIINHTDEIVYAESEKDDSEWGINVRTFEKVSIGDIGHSDKIICLAGTERE